MDNFKRLGLLLAAMFAIAVFAPAVAAAGEGTIEVDQDGTPCPITYDYTGSIPGTGDIENIESDGCTYEGIPIEILSDSAITATLTGTSSAGTASISGTVHARIFGVIDCYYSITVPPSGTYTGTTFTTSGGTAVSVPPSSGLCPTPLTPISVQGTLP